MRLSSFITPALAGVAAADQLPTEAYILRSKLPASEAPATIPHTLAEAILLQRLSTPEQSYPLGNLPESISQQDAVTLISQFGKPPAPLFQQSSRDQPRQLVISLSGVSGDQYHEVKKAIASAPLAFTSEETVALPIAVNSKCAVGPSTDINNVACWNGNVQYLRYNVAKDAKVIKQLFKTIATLEKAAKESRMETVFLLTEQDASLTRREEKPMSETPYLFDPSNPEKTGTTHFGNEQSVNKASPAVSFARPTGPIPSCFKTEEDCMKVTNNCTGHGSCAQKYSQTEGPACFHCKCMSTLETIDEKGGKKSLYHWGGPACQKIDVSTPFWLFAGTAILLASVVGMCISMMYAIGEQKLPGVIGAGVSRGGSK